MVHLIVLGSNYAGILAAQQYLKLNLGRSDITVHSYFGKGLFRAGPREDTWSRLLNELKNQSKNEWNGKNKWMNELINLMYYVKISTICNLM